MTKRGLISKGRRLAAVRFSFFAFGAGAFLSPLHVIAHEFKSLSHTSLKAYLAYTFLIFW